MHSSRHTATGCACHCATYKLEVYPWQHLSASGRALIVAVTQNCCSICLQWPTVVHATGYVVEITNQATMGSQRFMRAMLAETSLPPLVDLQVEGLQPGTYAACIRCVAPCGCESAASPWSFFASGDAATSSMPSMCPSVPVASQVLTPACPPPPSSPPCFLSTVQEDGSSRPHSLEQAAFVASPAGEDGILTLD